MMRRRTAILLALAPLLALGQGDGERRKIDVPAHFELSRESFPDSARNVTVKGGSFVRDGRPVFLVGIEAEMYAGAWLHRTLGIDFSMRSVSASFAGALKVTEYPGPGGGLTTEITERDDPWHEARIREALRGGTLFAGSFVPRPRDLAPKEYRDSLAVPPVHVPGLPADDQAWSPSLEFGPVRPLSDPATGDAVRWFARHARKYPVFLYEVGHEARLAAGNVGDFRAVMRRKYGTIQQANTAWGTEFRSFDDTSLATDAAHPPSSIPLWIDTLQFAEPRAVEATKKLCKDLLAVDPRARAVCRAPLWTGERGHFARTLAGASDVTGAQHTLVLHRQEAGQERWDALRQMLSQQLANDLVRSASPDRPILAHPCRILCFPRDTRAPGTSRRVGPAAVRMFLWHQAVHGVSGAVVSHFDGKESGGSIWAPPWTEPEAVKELPRARNEILSVADLVLPRPRIRGAIGLVYPRESARVARPDGAREQFVAEVLDYYAAAVFTRVPVDALVAQDILDGRHRQYPLLVLAHCDRVLPGVLEELQRYVERGGVLVVSPGSLLVDDRFGEKLDASKLLGGQFGAEVFQEEIVRFRMEEIPSGRTVGLRATPAAGYDFSRPVHGHVFRAGDARPLGQTQGGATVLAANTIGKGVVYTLAREFEPAVRSALLRWIVARHGLKPEVDVTFTDGIAADHVETHQFGERGRRVVYALNFGGGPRKALLRPAALPAEGARVTVRDVRTGAWLGPGGAAGRMAWDRADLERGIAATLPMHDPVVLLVEDAALDPLPLRQLSAEQERVLRWLYRPSPKSDRRVLIDGILTTRMHRELMPTAVRLLEDNGFQVDSLCAPPADPVARTSDGPRKVTLSSYAVAVLLGAAGASDVQPVLTAVQNGLGLLVCLERDTPAPAPRPLLKALGIRPVYGYMQDPRSHILREPKYVTFTRVAQHPVTAGVRVFQSTGVRPLELKGSRAYALVQGGEGSFAAHTWGERVREPGLPVVAALPYGKGRVVVIGSDSWLRPDDLELGDNRRLLLNAVQWLAGGGGDVAYVPPGVDEGDFAPRVRPADVVRAWDFERGAVTWQFARITRETAYTGKRCIAAGASRADAGYDVVVRTTWQRDGLLDLPREPHVNFAYRASKATMIEVRLEIGRGSPRKQFQAKVGDWAFVSLPINTFDRAGGDQANLRLMEVQIVAGRKGDGVALRLDDISITGGACPDPRTRKDE